MSAQARKGEHEKRYLQGVPPSKVSTITNSTCTNFSATDIKFVLVEFVISKFILVEFSLCNTQLVRISHSTIFPDPKNCTKRGPPVPQKIDLTTI